MRFYSFVFKNVVRRRVRSTLTVIGMAVAVGAVVALVGVSNGTERSFKEIYKRQNIAIIVEQRGNKQRLTSVLDEKLGDKIAKIPGVTQVSPGLVEYGELEELGVEAAILNGWPADSPLMKKLDVVPGGRLLKADDVDGVMLGEELAAALEKHVGDKIPLFDPNKKYTVVGLFRSPISYENRSMVLLLPEVQRLMDRQGKVSGFAVVVDHPEDEAEVKRICDDIKALGPRILARSADEAVSATTEIRFIRATSWITSTLAIIIGAVGMLNTMIMSVSERTREIGILRAIGWRQFRIVRMILVESVLLSLCGGVLGTVTAVWVTKLLGKLPAVAGLIDTHIDPSVLVFGILSALLVGLLGAAYPAFRGAQLQPTEALRHE
jgi:putative ABC transport system permease protein